MSIVKHRGKWSVRIKVNGERRRYSTGLDAEPHNLAAAEREARKVLAQLAAPVGNTLASIWPAYLDDRKPLGRRDMESAWRRLGPHFGGLRPDEITRDECRAYVAKREADGVSSSRAHGELIYLRAAVNWHDKGNTAQFWFPGTYAPRDRVLTREEAQRLLDAAACVHHLTVFLHLALATAARKEAILSLRWGPATPEVPHVDLDAGEVRLGRKSGGKRRAPTLPMTQTLRAVLQHAREAALTDHVVEFAGRPVGDIKKAFATARTKAALDGVTIHDLRHTAAVWMVGKGIEMTKVSQFLGHSSTDVTERVYARYRPDHLKDAAAALELGSNEPRGVR